VLVTVLVTLSGSYWFLKTYVFAPEFKPVKLSEKEQLVADSKLRTLGFQPDESRIETTRPSSEEFDQRGTLKPERYSEKDSKREISFNERPPIRTFVAARVSSAIPAPRSNLEAPSLPQRSARWIAFPGAGGRTAR